MIAKNTTLRRLRQGGGLHEAPQNKEVPAGCAPNDRALLKIGIGLSLVVNSFCHAGASFSYTATLLEQNADFQEFVATGLNDLGEACGYEYRSPGSPYVQPLAWSNAGEVTRVPIPSIAVGGQAAGIDEGGSIVGVVRYTFNESGVPVEWSSSGVLSELPLPNRYGFAAVTDGSLVVGGTDDSSAVAVWQERTLHNLFSLPGSAQIPFAINHNGVYVGVWSGFNTQGQYVYGGYRGDANSVSVLSFPGVSQPRAFGINDAGTIVGGCLPDGVNFIGYVAEGEDFRLLDPLPGEIYSSGVAINNLGDIVGTSATSSGRITATVYLGGSRSPTDLNSLVASIPGVRLVRAIDINNAGQLLIEGLGPDGYHNYILTPIPEPAGVLAGAAGLMLLGRRRRR
jgi:uncharacterized membrane protein